MEICFSKPNFEIINLAGMSFVFENYSSKKLLYIHLVKDINLCFSIKLMKWIWKQEKSKKASKFEWIRWIKRVRCVERERGSNQATWRVNSKVVTPSPS